MIFGAVYTPLMDSLLIDLGMFAKYAFPRSFNGSEPSETNFFMF